MFYVLFMHVYQATPNCPTLTQLLEMLELWNYSLTLQWKCLWKLSRKVTNSSSCRRCVKTKHNAANICSILISYHVGIIAALMGKNEQRKALFSIRWRSQQFSRYSDMNHIHYFVDFFCSLWDLQSSLAPLSPLSALRLKDKPYYSPPSRPGYYVWLVRKCCLTFAFRTPWPFPSGSR